MQVQRVGPQDAGAAAREILIDTRARLYGLLAGDTGSAGAAAPTADVPGDEPDDSPTDA